MPPTPGKRVTRSRAAATETTDEMNAPAKRVAASKSVSAQRPKAVVEDLKSGEETIARTAAKRPLRTTSNPTPAITTARRKIKVTPLDVSVSDGRPAADVRADKPAASKSKNSSNRKKEPKINSALPDDQQQTDIADKGTKPKTRRKATAEKDKVDETQTAPKTRGRPKKTMTIESVEEVQQQQSVRQTRTRAGSGAVGTQATAASTAKATTVTRKKVTFQDLPESDKENQPLFAKKLGSKGHDTTAAGGIRAKPIRKPATAKRRKTAGTTNTNASGEPKPTPLSPKKVTQVAKSSSPGTSDEDELSGGKTPVRDLSQSPKRSAVLAAALSPVKKLDFSTALLAKSSDSELPRGSLMSPSRKLPRSPFKDALKESPKRSEGALTFPSSALKAITGTIISAPTSQFQPLLVQSPKRGAIDSSIFTQSTVKPPKSPSKPTLMQSPPKRLFPSWKISGAEGSSAWAAGVPTAMGKNRLADQPGDVAVSCNFRASQSPERSIRVHKIGKDELSSGEPQSLDFDESILDIRSPIKVSKSSLSSLQSMSEEPASFPVFSAEVSPTRLTPRVLGTPMCQIEADFSFTDDGEPMEGLATSLETETIGSVSTSALNVVNKDMPNHLFRSTHFHDEGESSEDELQTENVSFHSALTETPRIPSMNFRSRLSTVNPAETSRNVGFTPLAAQFSSWLAASPDKAVKDKSQQRGAFSPLAAQHVPGKVQISRQSTPRRRSIGSRLSVAATTPSERRITSSVRNSDESLLAGTPERPSYFADEMAVKDLEDEVESMQVAHQEETKSSEIAKNTEISALMEEHTPEIGAECASIGIDNDLLLERSSNETRLDDEENISTTMAASRCFSIEVEAVEENPQTAVAEEVQPHGCELQAETNELCHQPAALMDDYATPTHQKVTFPRFVNTVVSKVPLRPEGYTSPIKIPKKRSRSLSDGPYSAKKPVIAPSLFSRSNTITALSPERTAVSPAPDTPGLQSFVVDDFGDSTLDGIEIDEDDENLPPPTPSAVLRPTPTTPGRSPLKAVEHSVLRGAIVFVDVHTTEGADASGIFVELLTQMGARCVRQWNWNPRASISGADLETENTTPGGLAGKVGITHVVYKDGGRRTLEKVRDALGIVRCVGVGWVLDCERENAWLDEAQYVVDPSLMPRGGSRRRKSMEPRALINMNGSLSAVNGRRSVSAELTPAMKADLVATPVRADRTPLQTSPNETVADNADVSAFDPLNSSFSTPTGIQAAFAASTTSNSRNRAAFATPTGQVNYDPSNEMSPTTPYYLSQGAKLVQQTCPPKQTQKGLFDTDAGSADRKADGLGFPATGRIEDQPDGSARTRLEAVRRKTMHWRPRVASPLGR